jgi:hypothetical protein
LGVFTTRTSSTFGLKILAPTAIETTLALAAASSISLTALLYNKIKAPNKVISKAKVKIK